MTDRNVKAIKESIDTLCDMFVEFENTNKKILKIVELFRKLDVDNNKEIIDELDNLLEYNDYLFDREKLNKNLTNINNNAEELDSKLYDVKEELSDAQNKIGELDAEIESLLIEAEQ